MTDLHLGFTGTRNGLTTLQETALHAEFANAWWDTDPPVLHHGDCVGADEAAHRIARLHGFTIEVHPPSLGGKRAFTLGDREWPPMDYQDRNRAIVDACTRLYACPKLPHSEQRSGTWATIRYARKRARRIVIIWPDGRISEETP